MYDEDATVFTAMQAGARGYLLKGAEQDEIADAIRAVVRGQAIFGAAIASRMLEHFANPPAQVVSDDPFPELSAEFYGPEIAELFRASAGEGELAAKLCAELEHAAADIFVEKTLSSAFFPGLCVLPELLRARGVETVIITGTVTNVCCESSARDARAQGFRVIVAADANAARTDAEHNAALHTIYRSFGDVRGTPEILELIAPPATLS